MSYTYILCTNIEAYVPVTHHILHFLTIFAYGPGAIVLLVDLKQVSFAFYFLQAAVCEEIQVNVI